jgi:parallel beta-helix repeat protein
MNKLGAVLLLVLLTGCSWNFPVSTNSFDPYNYPDEINTDDTIASGRIFYADPVSGSMNNDGSSEHPWSTLQEVIEAGYIETRDYKDKPYTENGQMVTVNPGAPVKSGDTIILRSGYHGKLNIYSSFNDDYITLMAGDGQVPRFTGIHIRGASKWKIKGLSVSPQYGSHYEPRTLIHIESHNWQGPVRDITIDGCRGFSVEDSSAWTIEDWNNISYHAISAGGERLTFRDNYFKNINFGISVNGRFALVKGNTIENFAGDGMRGIGNDMFFEYNTVKNCYAVNSNHDDGFQSWSLRETNDPPRERIVIRGNTIINNVDPDQPFKGAMQGIGCFDGPFVDWVIENNLVLVDHWHGISLYGAYNCRIVNNTVVDLNGERPGPSAITITDHKDGTPSSGCVIRNNIANSVNAGEGAEEDHNYRISYDRYNEIFVSPSTFDYHLKPGSPVIDGGTVKLIPPFDKDNSARVYGASVDIGAYEYK